MLGKNQNNQLIFHNLPPAALRRAFASPEWLRPRRRAFGGAFAAIVGTATCASCLAFLFGIVGLGIGSVAFVLKYQTLFLLGAIALAVISLYFTARKVNRLRFMRIK